MNYIKSIKYKLSRIKIARVCVLYTYLEGFRNSLLNWKTLSIGLTILATTVILALNIKLVTAQTPEDNVYLPLIVSGRMEAPITPLSTSTPTLTRMPTSTPTATVTPTSTATQEQIPPNSLSSASDSPQEVAQGATQQLAPININSREVKRIECSIQDWRSKEIRNLTDRILLDPNLEVIYPGALLQGAGLEDGSFTPITIPRSGNTITLSGLAFAPDTEIRRDLQEINYANVSQAIADILSADVVGTQARASYQVVQTDNFENMMYSAGIDARYSGLFGDASINAKFSHDKINSKNYVLLKFQQIFYNVSFPPPELATSVFRDGMAFQDPENQISPSNPPLYISNVSYGRMVFLLAESDFSAETIKASFEAAYAGFGADVKTDFDLTYRQIMERTNISYQVVGGDAELALEPLDTASPSEMYNAVKSLLSNKSAATFSPENPGAPIAYTLRYLHNREVARMSYTATYGKKDCITIGGLADLTARFERVKLLPSTDDECDSAEAYLVLELRAGAQRIEKTVWKDRTDRDETTITRCDSYFAINTDLHIENVSKNTPVEIRVKMFEKDGSYHHVATAVKRFTDANEWATESLEFAESTREANPYGEQDFRIEWRFLADW